jgi:hypothetical protein
MKRLKKFERLLFSTLLMFNVSRIPKIMSVGAMLLVILVTLNIGFVRADTSLPANGVVWVRVRGNTTDFVLARLKAAAVDNGLTCHLDDVSEILCQFEGLLYNAIISSTYRMHEVRIDLHYERDDDPFEVDERLEKKIDVVIHEFAKALKGRPEVISIVWCMKPVTLTRPDAGCNGQSLW